MQNQYPYSLLKRDERGYTILLLRDQQGLAFTAIAKELGLSPSRVAQKYNQMKVKQKNLYIRQIAAEQMCENTSQMKKVFRDAYECYQSTPYVCAYLEKMYPDILREYRARGAGPAGGVSRSPAALSSEAEPKDDCPRGGDAGGGQGVVCRHRQGPAHDPSQGQTYL